MKWFNTTCILILTLKIPSKKIVMSDIKVYKAVLKEMKITAHEIIYTFTY